MNISFDFDNTLQNPEIQDVVTTFKREGNRVIIITSRHAHHDNTDLFTIARRIGITEIFFTNGHSKVDQVVDNMVDIHFDDCQIECNDVGKFVSVVKVEPFIKEEY